MINLKYPIVAASAALVLAGCGGGGSDGGTVYVSPFAGHFIGPYHAPTPDDGTADITIDTSGTVTKGSLHDTTSNENGVVTGGIGASGQVFNAKVVFSSGTATLVGPVTLNSQKHMVGTLTETGPGGSQQVTFDLAKQ